jgi:hypothetical protein
MDKWNIGMMGLKDWGFLFKFLNPIMRAAILQKL